MSRYLEKMLGNIETRGGTQARINRMLGGPVPNSTQQNYHKGSGYDACKRALAKQRMTENERILDDLCKERPWLRGRKWPMFSLEGKSYEFTGVLSGGDVSAGTPPRVSSNPVFIEYVTAYLKLDYIDGFERAEAQDWLYQAQAQEDLLQAKEAARAISNQNLELSNFKDIDSPVQVAAQAVQSAKTVRFDKGFISDCASQNREPKYFTAFEMAGSLSKSQLERIERLTEVLGVPVMTKRLPWLGTSEGNKMAMLNCFLSSQARYYGIVELINSAGSGSKSYMDEEDKKRSLGSNKLVGEFDKDAVSKD